MAWVSRRAAAAPWRWRAVLLLLAALLFTAVLSGGAATAPLMYTRVISDNATGSDCTLIGNWDRGTKACALTADFTVYPGDGNQVLDDGINLDGAGRTVTGSGRGAGVHLHGRNGVTVTNLFNGIRTDGSQTVTVSGKTAQDNVYDGIFVSSGGGNSFIGNTAGGNEDGIELDSGADGNTLGNNTTSGNAQHGIRAVASSGDLITGNTADGNAVGIGVGSLSNVCGNTTGHSVVYGPGDIAGIRVIGNGNRLSGNSSDANSDGIQLLGGDNTLDANEITNFSGSCFELVGSSGNQVYGNTCDGGGISLMMLATCTYNTFYWNRFVDCITPIIDISSYANVFSLPYPTGGNYWSNWTAPDNDADGFVDNPYSFAGGPDNLPRVAPDEWSCSVEPPLALATTSVYWASMQDYLGGILSIEYLVSNAAGPKAYGVEITGAINSNGVTLTTPVPPPLGDVGVCCDDPAFTLQYHVPTGVQSFTNTVLAAALDSCGNGYSYP